MLAFPTRDGLVFTLVYGKVSDWVKNVLAAGQVDVTRWGRQDRAVRSAQLVPRSERVRLVPAIPRLVFRLLRVHDFLRVKAPQPEPHRRATG